MRVHFLLLALGALLSSCGKDKQPSPAKEEVVSNRVTMTFANYVAAEKLVLNTGIYTNQDGDDFRVTKFNYHISNIKLQNADGGEFIQPGFFLVSEGNDASLSIELDNVPDGEYTSVTFMIGIDSAANKKAIDSGVPTPTDEMYMNANAGYVMVNMEGMSPASNQPGNVLKYHIGGTSGFTSAVKPVTLAFDDKLQINGNNKRISIKTDLLKMFGPDYIVDFSTLSAVYAPGDNAGVLANNYKRMCSLSGIGE